MVLNKHDRQEKYRYKLRHGLVKKEAPKIQPKWSGKQRKNEFETITLDVDEMTSDWDSEVDEDIVNHFYPQVGDELDSWPDEMKRRIKRQVIEDLKRHRDEAFSRATEEDEERHSDGIYLGDESSRPAVRLDNFLPEISISKSAKKAHRKMPKAQEGEDILEEYGLSSYSDTIKKTDDYDDVHRKTMATRKLEDIPVSQLAGFRIGEDSLADLATEKRKDSVRKLTPEEVKLDEERAEKDRQNRLYAQMKSKFGNQPSKGKVLELNNFSDDNKSHVDYVNRLLTKQGPIEVEEETFDETLDELLGTKFSKQKEKETPKVQDFDAFMASIDQSKVSSDQKQKKHIKKDVTDEDFLDGLL